MPTPSYKALKAQNSMLMQMITALKTDREYGILTRQAVPIELPRIKKRARFVVFLDIDDCKGANAKYGYDEVNKKIRRAIQVRHADVLMRARWFSGDEIIIILKGDPDGFVQRLHIALKNVGLAASMAAVSFSGNLESDVRTAAAIVAAHKTGHLV